jgi:YegS/Rv2252/BmrU family lipid kinase
MTLAAPLASDLDGKDRSLLVIFNPTAGGRRRRRLDAALAALERRGWDCDLLETQARGDAERLAQQASSDARSARLLIAGGDGTINEAVNGALKAGGRLPLGIIPLGTANVLAAELGIMDMEEAVEAASAGVLRRIRPGLANGRSFVLMAGAGFDAHVVAHVDGALKKKIGKLAYVWTMIRLAFRFPFPLYRVRIDGVWHEAASVVVSKGHFYGGPFVLAPQARLYKAEFQVCLFTRGGRWNLIRYALALPLGLLPRLKDVKLIPAREVLIEGPANDPVQGDGDIITHLPVTIRLAEQPLIVVTPPARG